jgi:purine-binding chemotaxis protein CheW
MASKQLVIFKVNGEDFGIDINQVNIIEKPPEIFKVPNTPEYIEGLINLRGKVHTVFNLRKRFNLPAQEFDDNTKIIIVNANSTMVGLIVDEVDEIVIFDESNIENTPQIIANQKRRFLSGIAKKGDKIVLILDIENILSLDEEPSTKKAAK